MEPAGRVLFVCTHNAARSQMAEGLLRARHGDRYEAFSAGTDPRGVHPLAVRAMHEIGIDLSGNRSKSLGEFAGRGMDLVVLVCDAACPRHPWARQTVHASFPDPSAATGTDEERLAAFRSVRDGIAAWIETSLGARTDP